MSWLINLVRHRIHRELGEEVEAHLEEEGRRPRRIRNARSIAEAIAMVAVKPSTLEYRATIGWFRLSRAS